MAAALGCHDPGKLWPIELNFFPAGELRHKEGAADSGECQSVGFGQIVEVIGGDHPSSPRHVLHKKVRVAGNVLAKETRIEPHPEGVVIAGLKTDNHADGFALIKICLGEERLRVRCSERDYDNERSAQQEVRALQ